MNNLQKGLAIDTASSKGSISLFDKDEFVDHILLEDGEVSRSQDLVSEIRNLLKKNNIIPVDLEFVAYCRGPGGFTGIRIGAATSMGIAKSAGCVCVGITKFEALAKVSKSEKSAYILIDSGNKNISIGKYTELFEKEKGKHIEFETKRYTDLRISDFEKISDIIIEKSLYLDDFIIKLKAEKKTNIIVVPDITSHLIGLCAIDKLKENENFEFSPLYSN